MEDRKYTVITGSSSGIGYETAKAFASRGCNLVLVARRLDRLEELKREILKTSPNLDIVLKQVDLSVRDEVFDLYKSLKNLKLETWINNAGFGKYEDVETQNLQKVRKMIEVNIEALTILSTLFVRDYINVENTQLINTSSAGGYHVFLPGITYCATKFYVSAFTEGLAMELKNKKAKLQAKVLAPAATKTEFAMVASERPSYDYEKRGTPYHTSSQMASFLLELYDSDKVVGSVDRETFSFCLHDPKFV